MESLKSIFQSKEATRVTGGAGDISDAPSDLYDKHEWNMRR
jgi:hypothetical protein